MKIVQVFKPMQGDTTKPEDIQLIDGEVKHWIVQTTRNKIGENYLGWITRMNDVEIPRLNRVLLNREKGYKVIGLYLYDVEVLHQHIVGHGMEQCYYFRFDYIREETI